MHHMPGFFSAIRTLGRAFDDVVMPRVCVACSTWISGEGALELCGDCAARLRAGMRTPYCARCGRTMNPLSMDTVSCGECRGERHWNIAGMSRAGIYAGLLRKLLLRIKYAGDERAADVAAGLMAESLRARPWHDDLDVLVPVPMHWIRRILRPCNHALLLADRLGRRLGLSVADVARLRNAASQTLARSTAERFDNVRGCFAVRTVARVAGRVVCIVDNLIVSGATVHELSKVLRRAGARRIYAATAARATPKGGFQAEGAAEVGRLLETRQR